MVYKANVQFKYTVFNDPIIAKKYKSFLTRDEEPIDEQWRFVVDNKFVSQLPPP